MVKVLVVDDEYFAREGMKKTIDWDTLGCTLCGEADNGVVGVELARNLKPDIIITDIKMPGMDGIEMANSIKEFLPNCKFIIITGYDEFEYAKRAIKLNAVDFILKPIDDNELLNGVLNASEMVRNSKLQRDTIIEKLLLDCMRGKFLDSLSMLKVLKNNNITFENIIIANMENDDYESIIEAENQEKIYIQNRMIRDIVYRVFNDEIYVVECHQDKLALVMDGNKFESIEKLSESIALVKDEIRKKANITLTVGISNIDKIGNITNAYKESKEALRYKLYVGKDKIINYKDVVKESREYEGGLKQDKKDIILSLKARDRKNVELKLKHLYFEKLKAYKAEENLIRQISIELVLAGINVVKEYNVIVEGPVSENFNVYKKAAKLNTIDELYNMVYSCFMKIIDELKELTIEAEESGLDKAVKYINENFSKEISLSDVAKHSYLSESYLSRRMKKILGIGFAEYITKLRIEKSLELLKNPNAKIMDVALSVGYQDYRYFSQIFKKYTGYSPSEFNKSKE